MIMNLISQLGFYLIKVSIEGLGIGKAVGLAIGGAILTKINVNIDFSRLSLW